RIVAEGAAAHAGEITAHSDGQGADVEHQASIARRHSVAGKENLVRRRAQTITIVYIRIAGELQRVARAGLGNDVGPATPRVAEPISASWLDLPDNVLICCVGVEVIVHVQ